MTKQEGHGLREVLLQDVRDWVSSVSAAPKSNVVPMYDNRPKGLEKPFMTAFVTTHLQRELGHDEVRTRGKPEDACIVQAQVRGYRASVVQIDAFGNRSVEWLESLSPSLQNPAYRSLDVFDDMDIEQDSPVNDTATVLNQKYEIRQTQDFRLHYRVVTDWVDWTTAAQELDLNLKLKSSESQAKADFYDCDLNLTVG